MALLFVMLSSCKKESHSSLKVYYQANGADSGSAPSDNNGYDEGETVILAGNTGNLTKTGYLFSGWNTMADGNGTTYQPGASVVIENSSLTFYALWQPQLSYITVTVEGGLFRPAMEFSSSAQVTIEYNDGTTPLSMAVTQGSKLFDIHTFATSIKNHQVQINVTPWSALTVLNLGFRGGDGGNGTWERDMSDLPYIQFHPTFEAIPASDIWNGDRDIILNYVGKVTAIEGLSTAPNLMAVCCEFQPIEEIDLSGCSNLLTLEGYFSSIKKANFEGCTALHRCCLESTGAQYSWRMENGSRIETETLDLRDCSALRDIRGTGDNHTMTRLHPNALTTLWHFCKMGNTRMNTIQIGDEAPAALAVNRFTNLVQCWISYSPVIEELTISNNVTNSIWMPGCGVKTVDIHNQTQLGDVELNGNPITSININGCAGFIIFRVNNCGLSQTLVDYILATLDELNLSTDNEYNAIDLGGNNAIPSATGMAHAQALISRGWNVTIAQ